MMRQFIGLCAALAFVAASPSAYALKIADEVPANRVLLMADMDSFTYAAETLLTDEVTEVDGDSTKYYNVDGTGGNGNLVLSAPADVGATVGDIYVVAVTLNGMVFRSVPALSGGTSTEYDVATGGTVGDKMVVYRLSEGSIDAASAILSLTGQFAVSSRGGSASLTMTNQTLANLNIDGVDGSATHSGSVIKVAPALKETATPVDLTAEVVSSFKKFSGGMTVGHVGSIEVGIVGHRTADGGAAVADLEDILITALDDGDPQSTISFMGDFSFTEKVYVHGDGDCGAPVADTPAESAAPDTTLGTAATDIRMTEGEGDDEVVTDTTEAVNVDTATDQTTVSATHYLCLVVQGDDVEGDDPMAAPRIPDTDAYMVMGKYTGLEDAAIGPKPMERTLGEINRDGTTVHIPYMTTFEGYNQRLVLSNRSNTDAPYEITFRPEADVMAEGSSMAEGTLMGNSTVTFRSTALVTLTGGARTAATIILEAQPKDIDVTSVIVNTESRDTDTVVHHSM